MIADFLRDAALYAAALCGWAFLGIVIKPGASIAAVQPELLGRILRADAELRAAGLGGLRITSGTDGAGVHRPGSAHFEGRAVDVTPQPREDGFVAQRRALVIAALRAQGLRVLDEYSRPSGGSTGGHLHVELAS